MRRAEQAELFPRPGCEEDVSRERQLAAPPLCAQRFCDFEQRGDARGVVVRARVDATDLALARERARGAASQMVVVSTDDEWRSADRNRR